MTKMRTILVRASLFCAMAITLGSSVIPAQAVTASTATIVKCPYSVATRVTVGSYYGYAGVCFEHLYNQGHSKWVSLGDSPNGLGKSYLIRGSNEGDAMKVLTGSESYLCGGLFPMGALQYNGHELNFSALGGHDSLLSGSGPTSLAGGDGHDYLQLRNIGDSAWGDDDGDQVYGAGFSERLYGKSGNDCVYDDNDNFYSINCQSGSHDMTNQTYDTDGECERIRTGASLKDCYEYVSQYW